MVETVIHYLHREQQINASQDRVWEYFADPINLNELTPPDLNFEILTEKGQQMYAGQLIEYRVEIIPGIRSLWLTEIAHVREGEYFVDQQKVGPYRLWHHEHLFVPNQNGVRMVDHITYVLPFGVLGDAVAAYWVSKRLNHIFDYRFDKINQIFGDG